MNVPRAQYTMSLLKDGRVLATGGYYFGDHRKLTDFHNLNSAELYDPKTGTWEMTSQMKYIRSTHTASVLKSGAVLVTGGSSDSIRNDVLRATELYEPSKDN
jgi:N-acetylneuraminic acid mutarotase